MASFNPIIPNSAWSQAFQFAPGSIDYAGGETLRASFRINTASPQLLQLDEPVGISRSGDTYTVGLTGVQSALMDGADSVSFDLYAVKAGVTRALGLRAHVPVVQGL